MANDHYHVILEVAATYTQAEQLIGKYFTEVERWFQEFAVQGMRPFLYQFYQDVYSTRHGYFRGVCQAEYNSKEKELYCQNQI